MSKEKIQAAVTTSMKNYFDALGEQKPSDLYSMVIHIAEESLLGSVMQYAKSNQSLAAKMLGINRNTLRKKLLEHGLL
ncbi:MAG: Fis family transcriptional regulator [Burkholderiaceae bacterium]|jgi:Fis family transcriptional regulator|nr:Fis family transcriptional regulator [Burkholderiaceae bacterium]